VAHSVTAAKGIDGKHATLRSECNRSSTDCVGDSRVFVLTNELAINHKYSSTRNRVASCGVRDVECYDRSRITIRKCRDRQACKDKEQERDQGIEESFPQNVAFQKFSSPQALGSLQS
jgi:hypothetical protein